MKKLSDRHKRFCRELVATNKPLDAALAAGFSKSCASQSAYRLMQEPLIKEEIARLRGKVKEKLNVKTENVVRELARISFVNPKSIFDDKDNLKRVSELDDDVAAAISVIKIKNDGSFEYRFHDKNSALDKLAKHLGLYEEDNKQKNEGITAALDAALKRVRELDD